MGIGPKRLERYQKNYSEKGLWEKLAKVARKAGEKVIYAVLLLYYVLIDPKTPMSYKSVIIGALGYFILPMDIIPDFIPIAGFTDDLTALLACIKAVNACITPEIQQRAKDRISQL